MKYKKKITIPRLYSALIRRIANIPHLLMWIFPSKFSLDNRLKLKSFKDIHKGKRCFIIANGPSLNKTDLKLLENEIKIGMNRIYLLEKKQGFLPDYLVVTDVKIQLKQFVDEYEAVQIKHFYNWNARNLFSRKENRYYFKESFKVNFKNDFSKIIGTGKSVTFTCLQLAYYMGFTEVYLIGKDHSYNIDGIPHTSVVSNGEESNHFIEGYFKKGMRWDVPDYSGEEYAYKIAKRIFESDGRIIYDATIDGKLKVFIKVDYYSLFK